MSKRLIGVFGATLFLFSLIIVAVAQTPTTAKVEAVQNSDGTYTIVEYPMGKETIVTLNPVGLSGATGKATILRAADGTTIKLNLATLPTEVTAVNVYAIDPTGALTLLGPVPIANGAGTFMSTTPLTKFMLVASPDAKLSAYGETTAVYFRSAVPAGLTVIPVAALANATGEQVAAVVAPATAAVVAVPAEPAVAPPALTAAIPGDYAAPMLGIPTLKRGDDTKLKVDFSGAMEGARANIFIEPSKNGKMTEVRMRFHDLKEAPKGTTFILWAVGPNGEFTQLGQIVNVRGRHEAEIKSEVAYDDFGLLLTTEELATTKPTIIKPSGQRVGVIQLVP
jgi:hypothetical protein